MYKYCMFENDYLKRLAGSIMDNIDESVIGGEEQGNNGERVERVVTAEHKNRSHWY